MREVVVVMPAYNAETQLAPTWQDIPLCYRDQVLLVDDASTDDTVAEARRLGIPYARHAANRGYGANQKTCYRLALALQPRVVAMLHADHQYDPSFLPHLITPVLRGEADFMFGSRMACKGGAAAGGMPRHKRHLNRLLCLAQNRQLGVSFTEHFSGFRAYSAELLRAVPFDRFADDFLFDPQMVYAAHTLGFRIAEVPIPTRYEAGASSMRFSQGVRFVFKLSLHMVAFELHRRGLRNRSIFGPAGP